MFNTASYNTLEYNTPIETIMAVASAVVGPAIAVNMMVESIVTVLGSNAPNVTILSSVDKQTILR